MVPALRPGLVALSLSEDLRTALCLALPAAEDAQGGIDVAQFGGGGGAKAGYTAHEDGVTS
jgi:hypothetical protein